MNCLEEYIRNHKNLFDEEPATGHFERLQQRINRKSGRVIALRWTVSIAASIAILFAAGILWQHSGKQTNMLVCENASDLKICYLDRMNDVASRIETLISDFDPWDWQDVMNDVQNIIEVAGNFESEIPEELPEDKTKAILSDFYRQNLESLEMIAQSIKN